MRLIERNMKMHLQSLMHLFANSLHRGNCYQQFQGNFLFFSTGVYYICILQLTNIAYEHLLVTLGSWSGRL